MFPTSSMRRLLWTALFSALLFGWGLVPKLAAQTVQFGRADYNVLEGENLSPTLTFSSATSSQATFTITTTAGTATAGADFAAGPHSVTVPANTTSHTFDIAIPLDAIIEDYEAFSIAIASPPGGFTLGSQSTANIQIVNVSIVPQNWALIPSGINPGEQFRLLFKTGNERNGSSANIGDYDAFVRNRNNTHPWHAAAQQYSNTFRAVGSTPTVGAAWHTATGIMVSGEPSHTPFSHPIYWLNGPKIADDYNDFWDGDWDNNNDAHMRHADGLAATNKRGPNTGTSSGTTHATAGVKKSGKALGTTNASTRWGGTNAQNPIDQGDIPKNNNNLYIALSGVFEVFLSRTIRFGASSYNVNEGESLTVTLNASPTPATDITITIAATPGTATSDDWSGGPWTVTLPSGQASLSVDIDIPLDANNEQQEDFTLTITSVSSKFTPDMDNGSATVQIANVIPVNIVPYDWPLRPEDRTIGEQFRLLFASSGSRNASSRNISDYDAFVRNAAKNGHAAIRAYGRFFNVFGSTADISAREHAGLHDGSAYTDGSTGNNSSGIPIYWVNGDKVANNYHHFLDVDSNGNNRWDGANHRTEAGIYQETPNSVHTGTASDGTTHYALGDKYVTRGILFAGGNPLVSGARSLTDGGRFYGLSLLFEVETLPTIGFGRANQNIREGTTVAIPVTISEAQTSDVTVTVAATAGTASADDWTGGPWTVTIPANQTSATFDLSIPSDDSIEGAETFMLTLATPSGYVPTPDRESLTAQIVDVNVVPSAWSLIPSGLSGGDQFRLVFLGDAQAATGSNIATYDGWLQTDASSSGVSPTPHADIQAYSSTFQMVGSTASVDAAYHTATGIRESNSYSHTAWTTPIYWLDGAKIADDHNDFWDGEWDNQLSSDTRGPDGQVVSGAARTWTGTGTGTSHQNAGVKSANPLGASSAQVTQGQWGAGNNPINNNLANKTDSRRILAISQIFEVEPEPEVSIAADAASVTEGTNAAFTVSANPAPSAALAVSLSVAQTGSFGVTTGTQTLSIPTSGSAPLNIATTNDNVDEANGSVTVTVSAGAGYSVSSTNGSATVAIEDDDDPTPVATFASAAYSGGEAAGSRTVNVQVNVSPAAPSGGLSVAYAVNSSSTAGSGDYASLSGSLNIAQGQTSGSITVTIADDALDEGAETLILDLTDGADYDLGATPQTTITIADDDGTAPVATFASAAYSGGEAAGSRTVNVQVNVSPAAPSGGLSVAYAVNSSSTAGSGDYGSLSGSLNIAQGQTSGNITVTIADDALDEGAETLILDLTDGADYDLGATPQTTITIADDDGTAPPPPVASFASASASASESAGTQNATVNLSPAPSAAITLNYTLSGTATRGADYSISGVTSSSGTASVGGGDTSVNIPVAIADDSADESSETVILTLTSGTGYDVGSASVFTLTITDNDDAGGGGGGDTGGDDDGNTGGDDQPSRVTLSVSPNPVMEGEDITVTVGLSRLVASDAAIPLVLTLGDAEAEDYGALASIVIAANDPNGMGVISTVADEDLDDETFTVALGTLPPGLEAGAQASVEVTITDATSITSIEPLGGEIPTAFALEQNYPNPFNPTTTIAFALDKTQHVTLAVYDLLGQEVQVLVDGVRPAARYRVPFDATNLASGTYLYVLRTEEQVAVKTMALLK